MVSVRMKRKDRMEQILDCALELVGEKPLASIRTAEIAAKAGISEGAMFKYFATKDDIIEGIRQRYLKFSHPLKSASEINTEDSFREFLDSYLQSMIAATPQRIAYLRLLLQISMDQHSMALKKYEKIKNGLWNIMENRIEYGKKHWGYNPTFNTKIQTRLFHMAILMFFIEQEVFGAKVLDPQDLNEVKQVLIENLFTLLKKE